MLLDPVKLAVVTIMGSSALPANPTMAVLPLTVALPVAASGSLGSTFLIDALHQRPSLLLPSLAPHLG